MLAGVENVWLVAPGAVWPDDISMFSLVAYKCFLSSFDLNGLFKLAFFLAMIFEGDSSLVGESVSSFFKGNSSTWGLAGRA